MAGRVLILDPDERRRDELARLLAGAFLEIADPAGPPPDLLIAELQRDISPSTLKSRHGGAPLLVLETAGGAGAAAALAAGADDWLVRPFDPRLLLARARRLIRRRAEEEELRLRAETQAELGIEPAETEAPGPGRILVVAPDDVAAAALSARLAALSGAEIRRAAGGFAALRAAAEEPPDAVIVADGPLGAPAPGMAAPGMAEGEDALGLVGAFRSRPAARDAAIIHLSAFDAPGRAVAAFAAGADESAPLAAGPEELAARVIAEIAARRRATSLRDRLEAGLRAAVEGSFVDPLTGLRNRRYFDRHAARLFARARETGAPLAALLFDLDGFKSVNDAAGHEAGDRALRRFADRLRAAVRGADLVARIGGDEFAALLVNARPKSAVAVAERIRLAAAGERELREGAPRPTVSIGVACLRPEDSGPADLLRRADAALRAAKQGGRDRVGFPAA